MIIIAHRANLSGPNKLTENSPTQIQFCLSQMYHCEIDVWLINDILFLGHDEPQYKIDISFILENVNQLWCHCKHLESFEYLLKIKEVNCFYHQNDDYVLTSHGHIWVYPGKQMPKENGILVMPEWDRNIKYDTDGIYGICTDYAENISSFFN